MCNIYIYIFTTDHRIISRAFHCQSNENKTEIMYNNNLCVTFLSSLFNTMQKNDSIYI